MYKLWGNSFNAYIKGIKLGRLGTFKKILLENKISSNILIINLLTTQNKIHSYLFI